MIYGIIQYWCTGRGEFWEGTGCLHPLMELHIWFAIDFFHVILHKLCLYWGPMLPLFQILNLQLTWKHMLLLSWYYRAMYVFINDFIELFIIPLVNSWLREEVKIWRRKKTSTYAQVKILINGCQVFYLVFFFVI